MGLLRAQDSQVDLPTKGTQEVQEQTGAYRTDQASCRADVVAGVQEYSDVDPSAFGVAWHRTQTFDFRPCLETCVQQEGNAARQEEARLLA